MSSVNEIPRKHLAEVLATNPMVIGVNMLVPCKFADILEASSTILGKKSSNLIFMVLFMISIILSNLEPSSENA